MTRERIYKLKNGKEMVLIERIPFEDKRYLLLVDNKTNDVKIGYEQDDELHYIDETNSIYNELIKRFNEKAQEI